MGTLKLNLICDYDRLLDLVTRHKAIRQIDQIDRRVLQGQKTPHEEKVFSLFQPHTE